MMYRTKTRWTWLQASFRPYEASILGMVSSAVVNSLGTKLDFTKHIWMGLSKLAPLDWKQSINIGNWIFQGISLEVESIIVIQWYPLHQVWPLYIQRFSKNEFYHLKPPFHLETGTPCSVFESSSWLLKSANHYKTCLSFSDGIAF